MLISVNNLSKTFIDKQVLKNVSFHLNENDKCALVGINGCGKTTLIEIIVTYMQSNGMNLSGNYSGLTHSLTQDTGEIAVKNGISVGYLPQQAVINGDRTVYEEVLESKRPLLDMKDRLRSMEAGLSSLEGEGLSAHLERYHALTEEFDRLGGYMIESEVCGALGGLGFTEDDYESRVSTLSGGQKTRVALAGILVGAPDLIILDEPTNHLDISSIAWLEGYLNSYKGTVLIVSHDRYFLDRVVGKVVEIENGSATVFNGNYSDYAVKKEALRSARLSAYINQQRDIKHQREVIDKLRSFNREKSVRRADSRQKLLDKLEILDKPAELNDRMQIMLTPRKESGKDVLMTEGLAKFYDTLLFADVNIHLRRGEHVAIIGDNGTGKTTLLKIITGLVSPDSGTYTLGTGVTVGYYDQEQQVLDEDKTLFDEISDSYPTLKETEIRNTLAAFLFTDDDVFVRIGSLSGGEKGRVSLAKLMLGEANLLVLDEPTNHLDMISKEILEDAINNYTGTVLYVSHDRYFINRTADRILELNDHIFTEYLGDYDYYLSKKEQTAAATDTSIHKDKRDLSLDSAVSQGAADYKAMKAAASEERKRQRMIDELESEIAGYEDRLSEIGADINNPANGTDTELLIRLQNEKTLLEDKLLNAMERWEQLSDT